MDEFQTISSRWSIELLKLSISIFSKIFLQTYPILVQRIQKFSYFAEIGKKKKKELKRLNFSKAPLAELIARRSVKQKRLIWWRGKFGFGSVNFRLADSSGVSILHQPRNGCFLGSSQPRPHDARHIHQVGWNRRAVLSPYRWRKFQVWNGTPC